MTSDAVPTTTPIRAAKVRVPFWDNARFALIYLVVMGHAIQPLAAGSDTALSIYLTVYAFHMPAFIMISGYFAKAEPLRRTGMKKLIQELLLPYVLLETIWTGIRWISTGSADYNLTTASWTLWFLIALFTFRVVLPFLAVLRWPLTVSLLASVFIGYVSTLDSTFSMVRTISLLPFFVLGWKLRKAPLTKWWLELRGRTVLWVRLGGVLVLAALATVIVVGIDFWRELPLKDWFFYDEPGDELAPFALWIVSRPSVLAVGVLASTAFLVLVPRRRLAITALGSATMAIYLLHTFVLYPFRTSGYLRSLPDQPWIVILVIILALGLTFLLASPWVRRATRWVIEPRWPWIFARRLESSTETGRIQIAPPPERPKH